MSKFVILLVVCLCVFGNLNFANAQINSFKEGSVASFKEGKMITKSKFPTAKDQEFIYIIQYESKAPWAEVFSTGYFTKTGDMRLNELMESYDLFIVKQAEFDEETEIILIEQINKLKRKDLIHCGKQLSEIDFVSGVYVKKES